MTYYAHFAPLALSESHFETLAALCGVIQTGPRDDDWGSEPQVDMENALYGLYASLLDTDERQVFNGYSLKATSEESIDMLRCLLFGGADKASGVRVNAKTEFGVRVQWWTFNQIARRLKPFGFEDSSWHNDMCPSLHADLEEETDREGNGFKIGYRLWIDSSDPEDREMGDETMTYALHRYIDDEYHEEIVASDHLKDIFEWINLNLDVCVEDIK